ncbi:hypothetical protein ABIA31_004849 [Catenulispora sp. MAP5-51]|uniref:hypothetical protein n=1 Tax=Catenulispora sp. MAP5-51 TaxID=3156298 RepID=UPI0035155150
MRSINRVRFLLLVPTLVGVMALAACGSSSSSHSHSSMTGISGMTGMTGTDDGGEPMYMGDGLAASAQGYTFAPTGDSVAAAGFAFRILGPDGKPVTAFEPEQTKLMHFYLVRSDLSGFQHVHPTMAADGTWTAPTRAAGPGAYRVYAQFIAKGADGKAVPLVLSEQVTSAGSAPDQPLPAVSSTATVDGYTLTVDSMQLMAGMEMPLKVSIAKDGKPVTDLEPYLATYAHLSGFHAGDLAMAHLHPQGGIATTPTGGPDLTFDATLPKAGQWRMYLQFQTAGVLHTAAVTLDVR